MSDIIFQWHTQSDDINHFIDGVEQACKLSCKSLLLLACDENSIETHTYNNFLNLINVPVFGGIYPNLIFGDNVLSTGFIIIGFADELVVHNFLDVSERNLNDGSTEIEIELYTSPSTQYYFLFYDAFTINSETFIDTLFYCLGNVKMIGGGAGSLDFTQKPCIFSNQGVLIDASQLVTMNKPISLSVSHGWQILKGPYLVTEANKKTIISLNYEPAFNVYKEAIESSGDYSFNDKDFFSIAKNFPLGIQGADDELLVRDLLSETNNTLECVGDVPVNSMIYLLTGSIKSLTTAINTNNALSDQNALEQLENLFIVDCVSRYLYLENNFSLELDGILKKHTPKNPMFGVLSIGEVTNSYSGAIKLLNRTTVLGGF